MLNIGVISWLKSVDVVPMLVVLFQLWYFYTVFCKLFQKNNSLINSVNNIQLCIRPHIELIIYKNLNLRKMSI